MSSDFCAASSSASAVSREIVVVRRAVGRHRAAARGDAVEPREAGLGVEEGADRVGDGVGVGGQFREERGVGGVAGDEVDRVGAEPGSGFAAARAKDGPAAGSTAADLTADEAGSAGDQEAWRGAAPTTSSASESSSPSKSIVPGGSPAASIPGLATLPILRLARASLVNHRPHRGSAATPGRRVKRAWIEARRGPGTTTVI